MKHLFARVVCASACLLTFSGALLAQPAPQVVQRANQAEQKDDPSQGSTDVDRTVAYPMAQVLVAARQAMTTYECDVKEAKPDHLECTGRIVGVGAGGKVIVHLSAQGSETRVEVKTRKGSFRLGFGQKNWSTPIFDAMMIALELDQPLEPAQGTRVRVTAPGAARRELTGNILTLDEKTLTIIRQGGQRVKVPRELVTRLDVSVSRRGNALNGFLIGAGLGGLIGAAPCGGNSYCFTGGKGPAALWAVVFGGIGATLGHVVRSDKWAETPLDRVRVGLRPAPSGQGGGLTLTFAF